MTYNSVAGPPEKSEGGRGKREGPAKNIISVRGDVVIKINIYFFRDEVQFFWAPAVANGTK